MSRIQEREIYHNIVQRWVLVVEHFTLLVWEGFMSLALPVLVEQSRTVGELGLQNQICNICSHTHTKKMAKDATLEIQLWNRAPSAL